MIRLMLVAITAFADAPCAIAVPDTAVARMTSTRYHKVPPRQQSSSPSTCPDKHASPFDFTLDKCPKNPFTRPTGGDPNLHRITLKQLKCGFLRSPSNRWHMRARCRALANCAKP